MSNIAFKEWAVICAGLADGRQSLILRKGGIAEESGVFRPEHKRFLLYPTYFHEQQQRGIKPEWQPLLEAVEANRPPTGQLLFTHGVEVAAIHFIEQLDRLLLLNDLHGWTEETVRQRFAYRSHGLYVLTVRVLKLTEPFQLPDLPEYAGCKTWVSLQSPPANWQGTPVLKDEVFSQLEAEIARRLQG